jgi:hypothetical protein
MCPQAGAQPAGDDDEKTAKWEGTLDWSSKQPVPAGVQYFSGHLDLALDEDDDGQLKGTLTGSETEKLDLSVCPSVTVSPGSLGGRLTGKFAKQQVTISVADPTHVPPTMSPCPTGGPPGTPPGVFKWPHFDEALNGLKPIDDYNFEFDREWTVPQRYPFTVRYTLKMQRSKIMRRDLDE